MDCYQGDNHGSILCMHRVSEQPAPAMEGSWPELGWQKKSTSPWATEPLMLVPQLASNSHYSANLFPGEAVVTGTSGRKEKAFKPVTPCTK